MLRENGINLLGLNPPSAVYGTANVSRVRVQRLETILCTGALFRVYSLYTI